MRWRTGHRRRARAHARTEAERIRQERLAKLKRLVIRELLKRMVKRFEDLILHGSIAADGVRGLGSAFEGLSARMAAGGPIRVTSCPPRALSGHSAEFVVVDDVESIDR